MPSPDLPSNNFETEIQLQQSLRAKMNSIDLARDEFLRDVDKIRMEDDCLRDFKNLLEELSTERMALVNELRHVNTDINLLEQAIKQAEASRQKNLESAQKTYMNDMMPLRKEIDEIRRNMGKDGLPANLVDARDLEEVFPSDRKSNGASEPPVEPSNLAPTIWPLWPYVPNPQIRNHPIFGFMDQWFRPPPAAAQVEEPSVIGGLDTTPIEHSPSAPSANDPTTTSGSAFGHVEPFNPAIPKQQQPPMKTCASCQQQIHRNAPICPLCKSKSRSRHPKKKQRASKSDEQQQD